MNPSEDLRSASWKEQLAAFRQDQEEAEHNRALDEARRSVLPTMRKSLTAFLDGETSIESFKAEYDLKTRSEWNYFGFKGTSGAMFLNTLVIHLPDELEVAEELRAVLQVPGDDETALENLSRFQRFLDGQIEEGVIDKTQVQPSRGPFFVSGWWHVQEPEKWPIYYVSARSVLRRHGEFKKSGNPAEDYFQFRSVYLEQAGRLGLSVWEFEHLCAWLDRPPRPDPPPNGPEPPPKRVWLFAPGAQAAEWEEMHAQGIAAIGWDFLEDLKQYSDLEEVRAAIAKHRAPDKRNPINAGLACYQFAHEMQPGDRVLAKKGKREIIGVGTVKSDYKYEPQRASYRHVREVDWEQKGVWSVRRDLVTKTLTDIGKYPQLVQEIQAAIEGGAVGPDPQVPSYEIAHAERELFLDRTGIEDLLGLLRSRKNLILQGPPGTGKSYLARRLGWLATGERGSERMASVQFHQSYGYEDFVQGYRPSASGGFERVDGPFLRFCSQALQDQQNDYVLLIDEINRGDLGRIFGELMLLIEPDKRTPEWAVDLAYSTETDSAFHVPPNLLIIGTMNTADRSLALVDYALRRRFAFSDLEPAFSRPKFHEHLTRLGVETSLLERIRERMKSLNQEIRRDPDLGPGYRIGHSYFCSADGDKPCDEVWYTRLVQTEIGPLLREYWPEDEERARSAEAALLEEA